MPELSLLDYIKGRLAAHLPEGLRPRGWQPLDDATAAQLWEAIRGTARPANTTVRPAARPAPSRTAPPPSAPAAHPEATAVSPIPVKRPRARAAFPTAILAGTLLALVAQRMMEPPGRNWQIGITVYAFALAAWGLALIQKQWRLPDLRLAEWEGDADGPIEVRIVPLSIGLVLAFIAFLAFGGNRFTAFNTTIWLLGMVLIVAAFWNPPRWKTALQTLHRGRWQVTLSWWHLALLGLAAVAVYFRYVHLASVPAEMFSDHAEKLLDIADVLAGKTRIFFPRNTGREAIEMYLVAAVIKYLGTGYSFLSLKLGMVTVGLLALPFIYLLGKELGGKSVGFWAALFAAFAYWPNVTSRVALRFALYPAFAAPSLYFFVRGLRHGRRNDFLWAGLFLGAGVHGYSPFRLMPLTIAAALLVYWLYEKAGARRTRALTGFLLTGLLSFIVFLPLFRYMLGNWQMFFYRSATRLGQLERPYPGNPLAIFFNNLAKALIMPFWDDGEIWVHSIPHRPALDWVSGALFALGLVIVAVRLARRRHWEDAFLLMSLPLLMMPSVLSLAFPNENPCLNRTAGAYVVVFIIVGLAADALWRAFRRWRPRAGRWLGIGLLALLAVIAARANYDLVFHQYADEFRAGAWNTTAIGEVIHGFVALGNTPQRAWVIPYPYWVDTRLVAINAGLFPKIADTALPPQSIAETRSVPPPKLFILKPEDQKSLDMLQHLYPNAIVRLHPSPLEGKDFIVFFVP